MRTIAMAIVTSGLRASKDEAASLKRPGKVELDPGWSSIDTINAWRSYERRTTERGGPTGYSGPTAIGISRRRSARDAISRPRKVLWVVHEMLHGPGHSRAQEAGMGGLSPHRRRPRLQDLLRAAAFLPAVHLRLAFGSRYGAGFEAGKLPRRIPPAGRAPHRRHLRCRLSRCLAQAQRQRTPPPAGEVARASPQGHCDG